MNPKKIFLSVFALALLLAANLRVVYGVSVGGKALDGSYSAGQLDAGGAAAAAAANEITRGEAGRPDMETRARLTLRTADGDTTELSKALLGSVDGVEQAWDVTVDGNRAGLCSDPSALGEAMETILANRSVPQAIAVEFKEEVSLRPVFTYSGAADDLMQVSRNLGAMTEVVSVTAGGTVIYN